MISWIFAENLSINAFNCVYASSFKVLTLTGTTTPSLSLSLSPTTQKVAEAPKDWLQFKGIVSWDFRWLQMILKFKGIVS